MHVGAQLPPKGNNPALNKAENDVFVSHWAYIIQQSEGHTEQNTVSGEALHALIASGFLKFFSAL